MSVFLCGIWNCCEIHRDASLQDLGFFYLKAFGFLNLHPALAVPVLSPSQVCVTCQDREGITLVTGTFHLPLNVPHVNLAHLDLLQCQEFVLREMKFRLWC